MIKKLAVCLLCIGANWTLAAPTSTDGSPLLNGAAAEFDYPGGEITALEPDVPLFLDRPYLIKEVPGELQGFKFIRGKIDRLHAVCRRPGIAYVVTPSPERNPASREATLLELGFQKARLPEFMLFPGNQNRCQVYQKQMALDEVLDLGKWGVLIMPEKESAPNPPAKKTTPPDTKASPAKAAPATPIARAVSPAGKTGKKVYVLLFGGQSNALGWGYQQYLEDTGDPLAKPQTDIEMFYDIPGPGMLPEDTLLPLQSGNSNTIVKPLPNCYPALTTAPISRFGPELSFARTVRDHIPYPETKLAVIKFAMGGSSLWNPTNWLPDGTANSATDGKLYQIFQAVARRGITALKEKYPDYTVEVLGMGWVQGESDALESKGEEYQKHLTDLITDVRATFGADLPFVLAKISPQQIEGSPNPKMIEQWEIVRTAQDAVAASVPKVAATETAGAAYPVSKGLSEGQYHYTTPALLKIGRDMGDALVKISGLDAKPTPAANP